MNSNATQKGRQAELMTPLGADVLLINGFDAEESLSQLFEFTVNAIIAKSKSVEFDKLIGKGVTIKMIYPGSSRVRHFNGLCRSVTQGESDKIWTHYRLGLVPMAWVLTRNIQTRIFQHMSVPDILKDVLKGIDAAYELQGTYEKRDYCVQYRESDYHFAARLMEEEGIYYYFKHSDGAHKMLIADTPQSHIDVLYQPDVLYKNVNQAPVHDEDMIYTLNKQQQLTSGKVTLWDHCFEMTGKNLEAKSDILASITVGTANHNLKAGDNDKLEIYDYPGEYAQRFDGIDKGGSPQIRELGKIFDDNKRTTGIRMQAEAARSVAISGASTCRQFTAGHKFKIKNLADEDITAPLKSVGEYVLVSVSHHATFQDEYRSGGTSDFSYRNSFTAIPSALPYRPQRQLKKPTVAGCQTATVVGPKGEEIFTDQYGRIKVQFHWDRQGKRDADSSCWIRVGTPWAGRGWGMLHIPRIGQEVIVDFLEGDPDQPIVVGSVYNNQQMPAYELPAEKTKSYLKSDTSPGGIGHNEIRLEDKKGEEQIFMHGEKNLDVRIKHDTMELVLNDRHMIIGDKVDGKKVGNLHENVLVDKHVKIDKNQEEQIGGDMKLLIGGGDGDGNLDVVIKKDKKELIEGEAHLHIKKDNYVKIDGDLAVVIGGKISQAFKSDVGTEITGKLSEKITGAHGLEIAQDQKIKISAAQHLDVASDQKTKIGGDQSLQVSGKQDIKIGGKCGMEVGEAVHIKAGTKIILEAGSQISLKVGGNFVDISSSGVTIVGALVRINSGGAAGSGDGADPKDPEGPEAPEQPKDAKDAAPAQPVAPKVADDSSTGRKSCD